MDIIRAIDREIYNDKYSGAAVGVYHNNIIARDLGLSEKVDNKHDFSGGNVTFKVEGEEPEEQ